MNVKIKLLQLYLFLLILFYNAVILSQTAIYCGPTTTSVPLDSNMRSSLPYLAGGMKITGKKCSELGIVARITDAQASAMSQAQRLDEAAKNGKLHVTASGWPIGLNSYSFRYHNGKTGKYADFSSAAAGATWDGNTNGYPFSNGACGANDGYYYLFYQTTELKTSGDPTGTSPDCPVSGYFFVCDPQGTPGATGYTGTCPAPGGTATAGLCGNASLDPGEECDLGTAINNDTEATSFGCKTNCKKHDGWTCTKDIAEYKVKEQEAITLYGTLVTAQATFTNNTCNLYYAGDATKETACYGYQENLRKFKELNKIIKVTCGATKTFKERRTTSAQTADQPDYTVQCLS